ncbi:MAG: hypothetical protein KJN64_03325 [Ignavibacteria bacterium]|nr:hypothetical protein [Ignavibacteria bacterium]NNJ53048.1 hypothetical protein [Ignavibacteriaceae bacterium]
MDFIKRRISFLLIPGLVYFLLSCKTNPPSSPADIVPTGNVQLNLKIVPAPEFPVANKVVLLEDFANVSCNPCVESNRIIESLSNYTYGRSKLVVIKFPTDFPSSSDPFYLSNTAACDRRMDYYQILFAPTTVIDGLSFPISTDSVSVKSAIDARLNITPRFDINVTGSLEGDYLINVSIALLDTIGIDLDDIVIHTALTETEIEFEQAPGSNGERKFFDVMRLMFPSNDGEPIRNLINAGEINYQFEDALLSNWNLEKINAVTFIQYVNTKEVFQSGSTFE